MKLTVDRSSSIPVYKQIAGEIAEKIYSQELTAGFKLPPERKLAEELSVHRNTVIRAYDVLIDDELVVVSRQKPKGYFVKAPKEISDFGKRFFPLEKAFRYEFRRAEKRFNELFVQSETEGMISFSGIVMDRSISPITDMESVIPRIFANKQGCVTAFAEETEHLKENICRILSDQNMYVTSKNVQILAETNQIISYLAMLYLREGDCIIAEEPMVPDNFSIFYNRGIEVITVPMEDDGMRMDLLEEYIRSRKPKFIYTIPNFHNPTGITMSLEKRMTLLRLADTYNVPIIEEDYLRDFRYNGNDIPSLYTLDTNKMVIYLYSFTLIFPYMMKIGFAVGPSDFIDMLGYAVSVDETAVGSAGQYFLNQYIDSGEFERHTERVRRVYSRKLDLLCSELNKITDKGISYRKPEGGLLLWCTLDDDINERSLCRLAEEKGVLVIPGWVFYEESKRKSGHIRLSFSDVTDNQIKQGVKLLGEALDACRNTNNKEKKEGLKHESVY